jgi:hypothetical protein
MILMGVGVMFTFINVFIGLFFIGMAFYCLLEAHKHP